MGCFGKKKDEGRDVSRKIDDEIRGKKAAYQANHRLLFLGIGESGKTTIIKQMKSLHDDAVDDVERMEKVEAIKENIKDGILAIINAMESIDPPCKLENPDLQWRVDWIRDKMSTTGNGSYTDEFFDHVEAVWQDEGIQETFKRSHEYRLIESAQYFLNRVATIRKANYSPTAEDYLRCRVLTRGINETRIEIDGVTYNLFDVGGQSEERRKWIQCFNDVRAILFVVPCSGYNLSSAEHPTQNMLQESLDLFDSIWSNRFLKKVPIILLLNKQDLLRDKIMSQQWKLENYFQQYSDYTIAEDSHRADGCLDEVRRAKYFIRDEFLKIIAATGENSCHRCYPHFTCAIDAESVKRVFASIQEITSAHKTKMDSS